MSDAREAVACFKSVGHDCPQCPEADRQGASALVFALAIDKSRTFSSGRRSQSRPPKTENAATTAAAIGPSGPSPAGSGSGVTVISGSLPQASTILAGRRRT